MSYFLNQIHETLNTQCSKASPLLVHADVFRAKAAVKPVANAKAYLLRHMEAIDFIAEDRPVILPTFNYDFTKTLTYNAKETPSQIGPLTEYARTDWSEWQGGPPVYHFCGRGAPPAFNQKGKVDPFGNDSLFSYLKERNASVLMYGARFANFTSIHFIERLSGGPVYRYDKTFSGTTICGRDTTNVDLVLHCRPLGKHLDYDWVKLSKDAEEQGAIAKINHSGSEAIIVNLSGLTDFWLSRLEEDPLYLLDEQSRGWVNPMLDTLGRRFEQSDFE